VPKHELVVLNEHAGHDVARGGDTEGTLTDVTKGRALGLTNQQLQYMIGKSTIYWTDAGFEITNHLICCSFQIVFVLQSFRGREGKDRSIWYSYYLCLDGIDLQGSQVIRSLL